MKTAIMDLKDINPAKYNPRVQLKPGDQEWDALKNSLDRFGVATPLVVNETTGNLVSGHQRLAVLKQSGETRVEVVLIQMDEGKEKLLNVALNKIEGEWDEEKLKELFDEVDDEDIKFTGFTEEDIEALYDGEEPDYDEDEEPEEQEEKDSSPKEEKEEKDPDLREFSVFLSFSTKEAAEAWLEERGVETEYQGTSRNITIKMEGLKYGAGN